MRFLIIDFAEFIVVGGFVVFLLTQVVIPGLIGWPMFWIFRQRHSKPVDSVDIERQIKDAEQALELERRRAELDRLREKRISAILNDSPDDLEGGEEKTRQQRGRQSEKQPERQ